jgi:Ser/Thr protein kinase RdoA (MazF antagonist)
MATIPGVPVVHSVLAAPELAREIATGYEIGAPVACRYLHRGLNDTYLVSTEEARYVLRIYRAGWRRLPEIEYEMALLNHLHGKAVPVSRPVSRRDGALVGSLDAPEGSRPAVLFTFAEGEPPAKTAAQSAAYGGAAAAVHNASDDFTSAHNRFRLDLGHLVDEPLAAIRPLLDHRPAAWSTLLRLVEGVCEALATLPAGRLEWGFCHGDLHGGNAHIAADGTVTFFDFDCCGPGWRAYDIAVFRWAIAFYDQHDRHWPPFLAGYQRQRRLSDLDLQAVPLFVALRHLWLMGSEAANGVYLGYDTVDDRYFDRTIGFLRDWGRRQLGIE